MRLRRPAARFVRFSVPALLLGATLRVSAQDTASRVHTRVVSLAPSLTELVFALGFGERLVGRSSACDYPPGVRSAPVVGAFGRPNWEAVQGVRPDLVLMTDVEKPGFVRLLEEADIDHLRLPCESWPELLHAALRLGEALGDAPAGERFARELRARRDALAGAMAEARRGRAPPRIYVEVWGDPLTTAGGRSFLTDLVDMAGGTNIGASLGSAYASVSAEWVIQQDPEIILLAYMNGADRAAKSIARRPGWSSMAAVRSGSICREIPADLLLRPGPRLLEGAEALADYLRSWLAREAKKPENGTFRGCVEHGAGATMNP